MPRLRRLLRSVASLVLAASMSAGTALARAECTAVTAAAGAKAAHQAMGHATTYEHGTPDDRHHATPDGMRDCTLAVGCSLAGVSSPRTSLEDQRPSLDAFVSEQRSPTDVEFAPDTPPPRV